MAFACFSAFAQSRTVVNIDQNWQFTKDQYRPGDKDQSPKWENISLPHTWNKQDVTDDEPGYYRAACWYRKTLKLDNSYRYKKLFLYFNGANQETEVYVNGKLAGKHIGGYTRFCFEVSKLMKPGAENEIAVKVDNKFNEDIPPLTADFTFYGGIYRDVFLIATSGLHFDLDNAANGIFITTPAVSAASASVKIAGNVVCERTAAPTYVLTLMQDQTGKIIAQTKTTIGNDLAVFHFTQVIPKISMPHLWSPDDPYLYKVTSRIIAQNGKVIDEVSNPLGFRWFKFDSDKGFFLNDRHIKLIGANRHQDWPGLGNAIPVSYHVKDMELLKQMGGNFIRISHYPQDPAVLEACDRLGIVASVEIPVVNTITESDAFTRNCENMQVEMMRQNFNHPALVIWAYMNEILLVPKFNNDKPRQQEYFANVRKLTRKLDSLTRSEDPSRYTMISMHGDYNRYKNAGLIDIPMITGWNLYNGWYGGKLSDFGPALDKAHAEYPQKPIIVTEYGADADERIRATTPQRFDKSVDYSVDFHKVYLKAIEDRDFVTGGAIWNLVDFNSEGRSETTPHVNSKGLLTQYRKPKDVYRFYEANLAKKPYLEISDWINRAGVADSANHNVCTQPLMVFSDAKEMTLKVNGATIGKKATEEGVAVYNISFKDGLNKVETSAVINGKTVTDIRTINFDLIPYDLKSAKADLNINVILGTKRFYEDRFHKVWLAASAYRTGSFGYIGGEPYAMKGSSRQSYGTDRNILKTEDDPIYQTQQVGINAFKFDVPDGKYELTLHFAELTTDKGKEGLAYNLDKGATAEQAQQRAFDVMVNDKTVMQNFNPAAKYGGVTAGYETTTVTVNNGKGITVNFTPVKGEAILNAVQLKRLKE